MYAPIPMVPGPTTLHPAVLDVLSHDYPSGQIDADFLPLYYATGRNLAKLLGTKNDVVLMSGEGMLSLWSALKSMLRQGDHVVSIVTGVFGEGLADMAQSLGCQVEKILLPYNHTLNEQISVQIEELVRRVQPVMLTAVHCETPSGTLNPLEIIAQIKQACNIPFFCADVVSSMGGTPVLADEWQIDLALGGSQKCLSAPPSMSFLSVSDAAWERIQEVKYEGYDALLPFRNVQKDGRCPYTPNWHGVAALYAASQALLQEGLDNVYARHQHVAELCREGLKQLEIALWPSVGAISSPTVTAAMLPEGFTWPQWKEALRRRGVIVAGSFDIMADKVFRIGHMGTQARVDLVNATLEAIEAVLLNKTL